MRLRAIRLATACAAAWLALAPVARAGVDRATLAGPVGALVNVLAMVDSDPLALYAGSGCEVWYSADGGDSWESRGTVPGCAKLTLLAAPQPDQLYTAVYGDDFALLRSEDGGRSWRRLQAGIFHALFVDPADPSLILVGGVGIYRSHDGGESWERVFPGSVVRPELGGLVFYYETTSIYAAPGDPGAIYANVREATRGTLDETCFVSRDGGRTWDYPPFGCHAVEVEWIPGLATRSPDSCRVAWPYSVYCPAWRVVPTSEVPSVPDGILIIVPSDPPVLYVSDREAGQVLRSLDGGRSWSPAPGEATPVPRGRSRRDPPILYVHPSAPERLYWILYGFAGPELRRATLVGAEPLLTHDGRLETRVAWRLPGGRAAGATPVAIGEEAGAFWFFRPGNPELAVKLIDGREVNGRFWAFQTALTNLEHEVTVTDTATGRQRTWLTPLGGFGAGADIWSLSGSPPAEP